MSEALHLCEAELLQGKLTATPDLLEFAGHLVNAPLSCFEPLTERIVHFGLSLLDQGEPRVDLLGRLGHLPLDELLALAVRCLELGDLLTQAPCRWRSRSSEGLGRAGASAEALDEHAIAKAVALEGVGCGADVLVAARGVEAAGLVVPFPRSKPEAPKRGSHGGSLRLLEQTTADAQTLNSGLDIEANQLCADDCAGWRRQRTGMDFGEADQARSMLGQEEAPAWLLEPGGKRFSGVLGKGLARQIRADAIGGVGIEKDLNRQRGDGY